MRSWHEGIEAVLLDSGGVLLMPDPDAVRVVMQSFAVPLPDDETCWRGHFHLTREIDRVMSDRNQRGDADSPANWRALAAFFDVAGHERDRAAAGLRQAYNFHPWVPVPGAAEALLVLEDAGLCLAVVSNAYGNMQELLAGHGICVVNGGHARVARAVVVVDSHLVGMEKPNCAIFEIALAAVGKDPERCLYVGDTVYFDVDAALGAGMRSVHMDPPGFCSSGDHPHVRSLDELGRRLRGNKGTEMKL